jgi:hypothetical protein
MPPQDRAGLNHAGQPEQAWPEPRHPDHQDPVTATEPKTVWHLPKRDIELVAKKKVLDFKPAPRLEQVGDEHPEEMEDGKHHTG